MAIKFNQVILDKLKKNRTELSKKVDLSLLDEFVYSDASGLQEEVDALNYFTQEFFPEKFDQWYVAGREIYSIYFQRGEVLVTEEDLNRDEQILDKIEESANELGIMVDQIYPSYSQHRELISEGRRYLLTFEEQKQEFRDESLSV